MPEPTDQRIEQARVVPIASLLGAHRSKLRRTGAELVGPCPKCGGEDRFGIHLQKNVFNCRRCERGGDAIEFIKFYKNLDFAAAIDFLVPPDKPVKTHENGADGRRLVSRSLDHGNIAIRRLATSATHAQGLISAMAPRMLSLTGHGMDHRSFMVANA
jgi:CHC2 zinc finger